MRSQGWGMFQSLLLIAFTVFSLTLAIGGLAQVGRVLSAISGLNISLPTSLGGRTLFSASSTIPYPEFVNALQHVPLFGIKDAVTAALLVTFGIFLIRLWQGYRLWKNLRRIRQIIRELDHELGEIEYSKQAPHH